MKHTKSSSSLLNTSYLTKIKWQTQDRKRRFTDILFITFTFFFLHTDRKKLKTTNDILQKNSTTQKKLLYPLLVIYQFFLFQATYHSPGLQGSNSLRNILSIWFPVFILASPIKSIRKFPLFNPFNPSEKFTVVCSQL